MLLILALILINVATYAIIVLTCMLIIFMALQLIVYGLAIFTVFMLLAELHVFYIITCLSLTWVRFDTVTTDTLLSSRVLNNTKLYAMAAIAILWACAVAAISNSSLFLADTYTSLIVIDSLNSYQTGISVKTASLLTLLATAYLTTQSFEFCILNLIMLLAVLVLFSMQQTSRKSILTEAAGSALNIANITDTSAVIIRQQNQTRQLVRDPAVRCVTLKNSSPVTKAATLVKINTKKL